MLGVARTNHPFTIFKKYGIKIGYRCPQKDLLV